MRFKAVVAVMYTQEIFNKNKCLHTQKQFNLIYVLYTQI